MQGLLTGHLCNGLKTFRRKGKLFAQFHLFKLVLVEEALWLFGIGHLSSQQLNWRFFKELLFCIAKRIPVKEEAERKRLLITFLSSQIDYVAKLVSPFEKVYWCPLIELLLFFLVFLFSACPNTLVFFFSCLYSVWPVCMSPEVLDSGTCFLILYSFLPSLKGSWWLCYSLLWGDSHHLTRPRQ